MVRARSALARARAAPLWLALFASCGLGAAPLGASALPLVHSYAPGGHPQYWAIAQDPRGVLYFGSGDGVLEHAGGGWGLYVLPRRGTVRSLASADDGTVYVGSQGDFGYLALAPDGRRSYVSLLSRVPPADRVFGDVWKTHVTAHGVYFQAYSHLFRWSAGELRVWRPQSSFHFSFVVDGTLYVLDQDEGLLRMAGDRLEGVPGGQTLAGDRLYAMLPLGDGRILLGTRRQGLFAQTREGIEPFPSSAAPFLAEHQLYHGAVLPGGRLALGTLTGGVAIVDRDGELLQVLDRSTGLRSQKVTFAFVDREKALWLAQEGAIARVEVQSPLSVFQLPEPDAVVVSLAEVGDRLYVGTGTALHSLSLAVPAVAARIETVPGIDAQVFDLVSTGDGVLAATSAGVFHVREHHATAVAPGISSVALASRRHPGRYHVGQIDGVRTLERGESGWRDLGLRPGVAADVRTLHELPDGGLWLGTKAHGLYRVDPATATGPPTARRMRGLPEGSVDVRVFHGKPVFLSNRGIHTFDAKHGKFPLLPWSAAVLAGRRPTLLDSDHAGSTWLSSSPGSGASRTADELSLLVGDPPRKSSLSPIAGRLTGWSVMTVLTDRSGVAWLGTRRGLVRLDASVEPPPRPRVYRPLCRLEREQALVDEPSAGNSATGGILGGRAGSRSLVVECALPSYLTADGSQFRFALAGVDDAWSPWQAGGSRLYAGLPYGRLRLRAQARDGWGRLSEVVEIPFEVAAPWYRTSPAYLAAVLLVTGVLASGYRLRMARTDRRRRELEELVTERTRELRKSERNLRDLFENASDVIFVLDEGGRVVSLNPAIEEVGYPRAVFLNRPLADFVRPADRAKIQRWYDDGGVSDAPVELTLAHGGTVRTLEVKVRSLGEGTVSRVEGVARDVSERRARLDATLSQARLRALQSQLQPHFLFNCLNGIAGLVGRDDGRARQMLAELGDLLRFSLQDDARQEVSVWQELAVLGKYVALQRTRFGDRLRVDVDAPDALADLAVPRFVLQPLVENSIKHGVEQLRQPIRIQVTIRREGDSLRLLVADDGPGFPVAGRPGVGLANLRERLRALYGSRQSLEIRSPAVGGAEVEIVLPARALAGSEQVVQR